MIFLLISASTLVACSAPEPATSAANADNDNTLDNSTELDLSFCNDVLELNSGTLCALAPSTLDSRSKDAYGTATVGDASLGFGYHVIAFPKQYASNKGLWVHFTGTYGRPYNQNNSTFTNEVLLEEILEQGYTVIQLAYDNRFSVNEDTCSSPNPGYNRNNCAGEVREEVLTGVNRSPYRTTDTYNSVDYRLKVLLQFLQSKAGMPLPASLDPANIVWSDITVSGHSQGGNLAYYVAKFRGVKYACLLGSPYDVADSVSPTAVVIADWFQVPGSLTPISRVGQFITKEDDTYNAFKSTANYLGMRPGIESFETSQAPYHNLAGEEVNGHGAVIADPSLKAFRAQACFR